jgi:hypothetical protein
VNIQRRHLSKGQTAMLLAKGRKVSLQIYGTEYTGTRIIAEKNSDLKQTISPWSEIDHASCFVTKQMPCAVM